MDIADHDLLIRLDERVRMLDERLFGNGEDKGAITQLKEALTGHEAEHARERRSVRAALIAAFVALFIGISKFLRP